MDAVLSHEGIFNENEWISHHKKQALSVLDQWDLA